MKIQTLKANGSKKFLFLAGINRAVIPAQVSVLAHSIQKMGCIRDVIVAKITFLGRVGLYIIDGQHLFHALLRNGMDIPYRVIDCIVDHTSMIETIALLNASSKSWTMQDYITAEIAKATQLEPTDLKPGKTFSQKITFEESGDWKESGVKPMQRVIKLQRTIKNNSIKLIKQKKHGNY